MRRTQPRSSLRLHLACHPNVHRIRSSFASRGDAMGRFGDARPYTYDGSRQLGVGAAISRNAPLDQQEELRLSNAAGYAVT
jgi:hypothetical protein